MLLPGDERVHAAHHLDPVRLPPFPLRRVPVCFACGAASCAVSELQFMMRIFDVNAAPHAASATIC